DPGAYPATGRSFAWSVFRESGGMDGGDDAELRETGATGGVGGDRGDADFVWGAEFSTAIAGGAGPDASPGTDFPRLRSVAEKRIRECEDRSDVRAAGTIVGGMERGFAGGDRAWAGSAFDLLPDV